jgi:hypothetical protein
MVALIIGGLSGFEATLAKIFIDYRSGRVVAGSCCRY